MQIVLSQTKINSLIKESVLLNVREIEFQQVLKEVYPYFKHVIEEENAKLRRYMLTEGYINHYEYMLSEQNQLEEGWLDIMADVGITAGQMIGGPVGQAAGFAGAVKYTKDFIGVADKSFLEMVGPLLGLFFSMQALLFPMPAVGTIKGILLGFFKGVGNVISGAGGLLARGVTALLSRGHGFIGKAIEILGKALNGITAAIKTGGPTIAKIEGKVGGNMLSKAIKAMGTAMENFMKRLGILKEGLKKLGNKDVKEVPGMVKDILTKAFQTGKDKLDDVANAMKQTKIGKAVVTAKSKAGKAFQSAFGKEIMKASDDVLKISVKGATMPAGATSAKVIAAQNGALQLQYLDDAGKVMSNSYLTVKESMTIVSKNPTVKKWLFSGLDDAGREIAKKSLGTATSTTKAVLKTSAEALKSIPSKLLKTFKLKAGNTARSLNRWITNHMAKNPQLIEGMIGVTIKGSTKGHKYTLLGVNEAGKMLVSTNKIRGKIVEPFIKAVPPNMFFSSYGRQIFNPKLASNSNVFKHFLGYLRHVYPPKRAIADMARIKAATGRDARIVSGSYGDVEMPD